MFRLCTTQEVMNSYTLCAKLGNMTTNSDEFFGGAIKIHREAKGWSKNVFAQKLRDAGLEKFHPTTVTRLEEGTRPTRLNEAAIIARVLEHSIDSLVNFTYPYEDLDETVDVYDHACKELARHEQILELAKFDAEEEERELTIRLLGDGPISDNERAKSVEAIERFKLIAIDERVDFWREELPELDFDDFFDFRYEAIRAAREARVKAAGDGNDS